MANRTCFVDGCDRPVSARGWCSMHYQRWWRSGDVGTAECIKDSWNATCSVEGCGRSVRARQLCSMHYRRWERATGRAADEKWNDRRRAAHHEREAAKRGVESERFVSHEIFTRDNWICGICGESVDSSIGWPDPMSASLDHIVPLSRGGSHTRANTQCAHLRCNIVKGNQMVA